MWNTSRLLMHARQAVCFGSGVTTRPAGWLPAATNRQHVHLRALFKTRAASSSLPVVIETRGVPVYLYTQLEDVEPDALQQLVNMAESPLPVGFVSAMPDVHLGKGVTIGSVFASDRYVCPNAVGVDIGCGMCAVPLQKLYKTDLNMDQMQRIQSLIKRRIPTGFDEHKKAPPSARQVVDTISAQHTPSPWLLAKIDNEKVPRQIGTLGGGNHFLEVVHDEDERVFILLHSGSRNIGNITAEHYDRLAMEELKKKGVTGARREGINYLEIDSPSGQSYLGDMQWCQEYAFQNRKAMLDVMVDVVNEVTGALPDLEHTVNIHHNYCSCERCKYKDPQTGEEVERDLWVTRKGATSARQGQMGIIPGSMGVGSFIVRGKGESKSWQSCSHGAGRKMSRTKAVQAISQDEFEAAMTGVVCDTDPRVRDEAPQAYKDLTLVMKNQEELVEVVHRLRPLINVKGFGKSYSKKK